MGGNWRCQLRSRASKTKKLLRSICPRNSVAICCGLSCPRHFFCDLHIVPFRPVKQTWCFKLIWKVTFSMHRAHSSKSEFGIANQLIGLRVAGIEQLTRADQLEGQIAMEPDKTSHSLASESTRCTNQHRSSNLGPIGHTNCHSSGGFQSRSGEIFGGDLPVNTTERNGRSGLIEPRSVTI